MPSSLTVVPTCLGVTGRRMDDISCASAHNCVVPVKVCGPFHLGIYLNNTKITL